ncbi:MAG: hypothetical protein UU93_C0008G0008 [Candidatus Amesbacteria bacterium GW2011_GWA2_42_12]|uniref:N-acetyltransferase domain-containing protein n=1 Tax=Candidatus Amesbacteria bacterium GW2011_GWA2_42_12 TaxID=1618356 RepID=A0A0G1ADP8_9BACT|nr:MAG: hypothetical protein UU93_C0008G0008 [Candidatus Amesbacteria bacterium GW2011_GWA2_42_12]
MPKGFKFLVVAVLLAGLATGVVVIQRKTTPPPSLASGCRCVDDGMCSSGENTIPNIACDDNKNGFGTACCGNAPAESAPPTASCDPNQQSDANGNIGCGDVNQGYCTRCNENQVEYFCKSGAIASGAGCIAAAPQSTGGTAGTNWQQCNPNLAGTQYGVCSGNSLYACGSDFRETKCVNNHWEATGNCCQTPGDIVPPTTTTDTTTTTTTTTTQTASSVAQTALASGKCDINFGLCQAFDPKTGEMTGWVPATKSVFCDSSCALAARMNVIIGSGYQTITIDGKQYQAYDWNVGSPTSTQAISLSGLSQQDVAEIKQIADANKVQFDSQNNAIVNLTKDQIADLQKRVDNFSKEQESVQIALAADINKKIPGLLAECNCSPDKFAEFVKGKSENLHLNLLTSDNATLILTSANSYAIDNGLINSYSSLDTNSVIQACYNLLKNDADKTDCENLSLARQTLRDAISSDNRTLADDQLRANQKANDLANRYQKGEDITETQLRDAGIIDTDIKKLTEIRQQNLEIARQNQINTAALNLHNAKSQGPTSPDERQERNDLALSGLDATSKIAAQKNAALLQQYIDCRSDKCTNLFSQLQSVFPKEVLTEINKTRIDQITFENTQYQAQAQMAYQTTPTLPKDIQTAVDTKYTQLETNLIMTRLAASENPDAPIQLSDAEKENLRQQALVDTLSQSPQLVTLNPSTDDTGFQNYLSDWKANNSPLSTIKGFFPPTIDQLKQDAVKFAVQTCAAAESLSGCTQSMSLDKWGAAQRIFEADSTLKNLPPGSQLYQDFIDGKVNPIELEQNLINIKKDWVNGLALNVNNVFQGTTATGTLLQKEALETGDTYKYMRGTWIAGAPIAASAVAIAGIGLLPVVAPTVAAVTGTGLLGGTLTTIGTGFGIYGTTQGIGSTYQACEQGVFGGTDEQKYACAIAGGNTIYMALSTGMGVATGAYASASKAATTLNLSKIGNSGATLATDVNTTFKMGTAAINTPAWIEKVGFANSMIGMGVFGSQAVVECGKGFSTSCVINLGMAIGSLGHSSTFIASKFVPNSNISAAIALGRTRQVSGEISELSDKLDGLNSCNPGVIGGFNIGDCISGLIDGFADGNSISVKDNMLQAPSGLVSARQNMDSLATSLQTSSTDALPEGDRITMTKAVMDAIDENRYIQVALKTRISNNPTIMQQFLATQQTAYQQNPSPTSTYNLLHALYLVQQEQTLLAPIKSLSPSQDLKDLRLAQQQLDQIAHSSSTDITSEYLPQANKVIGLLIAAQKDKFTPEQAQNIETALNSLTNNLQQQADAYAEAAKQTGDPSFTDAAQKAEQTATALNITPATSVIPDSAPPVPAPVLISTTISVVGQQKLPDTVGTTITVQNNDVVTIQISPQDTVSLNGQPVIAGNLTLQTGDVVSVTTGQSNDTYIFSGVENSQATFTHNTQTLAPTAQVPIPPITSAANHFGTIINAIVLPIESELNIAISQISNQVLDPFGSGIASFVKQNLDSLSFAYQFFPTSQNVSRIVLTAAGETARWLNDQPIIGNFVPVVELAKDLQAKLAKLTTPAPTVNIKFENEMRLNVGPRAPYHLIRVFFNGDGKIVAVSQEKYGETSSVNNVLINGKLINSNQPYLVNNRDRVTITYDGKSENFVVSQGEFIGKNGIPKTESKYVIGLYPPPTGLPIPAPSRKFSVVDFAKETADNLPCLISNYSIVSPALAAGSSIPCGKVSINTSGRQVTSIDGVGKVYVHPQLLDLAIISEGEGIYRTAKVGETVQIINSSGEAANIKVISITKDQIVVKIDNKPNTSIAPKSPSVSRPHLTGDEPKISPIRDPNKSGPTYEYHGYEAYDSYVQIYGQQPTTLYVGAKPTDLFPFQEDLIKAAQGQAIDLNKVIKFLNQNKIGVNIYSDPAELVYADQLSDEVDRALRNGEKPKNNKSDIPKLVKEAAAQGKLPRVKVEDVKNTGFSINTLPGLLDTLTGKNKQEIYLLTPNLYAQLYQTTPAEGLIVFYQKLGHEGGHSMDDVTFGNLSPWATELRQKAFNVKLYQAIGDVQLAKEYQKFVDETLSSSKHVLYDENQKISKTKYQSALKSGPSQSPIFLTPLGSGLANPILAPIIAPIAMLQAVDPILQANWPDLPFSKAWHNVTTGNWGQIWQDITSSFNRTLPAPLTLLNTLVVKPFIYNYRPPQIPEHTNTNYQPFGSIIDQAISQYQNSTGKSVYWPQNKQFSLSDFISSLFIPLSFETQSNHAHLMNDTQKMPHTEFESLISLWITNRDPSSSLSDLLSNTRIILYASLPPQTKDIIANAYDDSFNNYKLERKYQQAKVWIETNSPNSPMSSASILSHFIEQNSGNLSLSLDDLSGFLRWIARSTGSDSYIWMRNHIADEFSPNVSFNSFPSSEEYPYTGPFGSKISLNGQLNYDYSLLKQVGKPYHSAHIVSLLSSQSTGTITFMVFGEYILHGREHGLEQFISDMSLLANLSKINKSLRSLPYNAHPPINIPPQTTTFQSNAGKPPTIYGPGQTFLEKLGFQYTDETGTHWKWPWGKIENQDRISQIISDVHAQVQKELAQLKTKQEIIDYITNDLESMGVEVRDGTPRVATKGYDAMKDVGSMNEIYIQVDRKRPAIMAHEWEHVRQVKAFLEADIHTGLLENSSLVNQIETPAYATGTKLSYSTKAFDVVGAITQPLAFVVAKAGLIGPLNTFSRVVTYPINSSWTNLTKPLFNIGGKPVSALDILIPWTKFGEIGQMGLNLSLSNTDKPLEVIFPIVPPGKIEYLNKGIPILIGDNAATEKSDEEKLKVFDDKLSMAKDSHSYYQVKVLDSRRKVYTIQTEDGEVIAAADLLLPNSEQTSYALHFINVLPEYQGHYDVGSALLRHIQRELLTIAINSGKIQQLRLATDDATGPFYEKLGFTQISSKNGSRVYEWNTNIGQVEKKLDGLFDSMPSQAFVNTVLDLQRKYGIDKISSYLGRIKIAEIYDQKSLTEKELLNQQSSPPSLDAELLHYLSPLDFGISKSDPDYSRIQALKILELAENPEIMAARTGLDIQTINQITTDSRQIAMDAFHDNFERAYDAEVLPDFDLSGSVSHIIFLTSEDMKKIPGGGGHGSAISSARLALIDGGLIKGLGDMGVITGTYIGVHELGHLLANNKWLLPNQMTDIRLFTNLEEARTIVFETTAMSARGNLWTNSHSPDREAVRTALVNKIIAKMHAVSPDDVAQLLSQVKLGDFSGLIAATGGVKQFEDFLASSDVFGAQILITPKTTITHPDGKVDTLGINGAMYISRGDTITTSDGRSYHLDPSTKVQLSFGYSHSGADPNYYWDWSDNEPIGVGTEMFMRINYLAISPDYLPTPPTLVISSQP